MYRLACLFAFVAATATVALAMPTNSRDPTKFDLSTIVNKTVCPMRVRIDEDPKRIPKRIKVMECERDPNQWCSKMHIPKHECCQHQYQHNNVRLECVEIQDRVQVSYPERNAKQEYRVSIGCTCAMLENAAVDELNALQLTGASLPPPSLVPIRH